MENFSGIKCAQSPEDIAKCFSVAKDLRPHLRPDSFIEQVKRQRDFGYKIIFIERNHAAVAFAGYRITEFLAWGKILYIDDLATLKDYRGHGLAGLLLDFLIDEAKTNKLAGIHLDTGHGRHEAHRLYLKKGFLIKSHHLSLALPTFHGQETA